MGLVIFFVFALYLLLSLGVVALVKRYARNNNKNEKRWGWGAVLVMYLLVFWDLIPVYAVHAYQCNANAGFNVYKNLDEWKQENPGLAETLTPIKNAKWQREGNITRVPLNQRFVWQTTKERVWHIVYEKDEKIIDTETNEVIAQYIDYYTTQTHLALAGNDLSDLKFWLKITSCEKSGHMDSRENFFAFEEIIEKLGSNK